MQYRYLVKKSLLFTGNCLLLTGNSYTLFSIYRRLLYTSNLAIWHLTNFVCQTLFYIIWNYTSYSVPFQGEVLSQEPGAPLALSSLSCVKEEREERDVGEEGKKRMETVKEDDGESEESEDREEREGREEEEKTAHIQDIFFSHYPNIR